MEQLARTALPVFPVAKTDPYTVGAGKLGAGGLPARTYCVDGAANPQELRYAWGSMQSVQFGWVFTK